MLILFFLSLQHFAIPAAVMHRSASILGLSFLLLSQFTHASKFLTVRAAIIYSYI